MLCSKLSSVVQLAEYIPWGWYGIERLFLKREMSIKIFKGFQSKSNMLTAYKILKASIIMRQ